MSMWSIHSWLQYDVRLKCINEPAKWPYIYRKGDQDISQLKFFIQSILTLHNENFNLFQTPLHPTPPHQTTLHPTLFCLYRLTCNSPDFLEYFSTLSFSAGQTMHYFEY